MKYRVMPSQKGFTLLELLVVIAIIAILTAIAVPSYQVHIINANRQTARTSLLMAQQMMERHYLRNSSYVGGLSDVADRNAVMQPMPSNTPYTLLPPVTTQSTYTLTVVPPLAMPDPLCGSLTINQNGIKAVTGAAKAAVDCWQ